MAFPTARNKVVVSPVQWLPGSLSAAIPFFAMNSTNEGVLYFRGDDPNIYGVAPVGVTQTPSVSKNGVQKPANKGCNFYSAPWCIPTLSSRDMGRRVEVTSIDPSIYTYITDLYGLLGQSVSLTDWKLEQSGYVKLYQVLQGNNYVNINGKIYFGGSQRPNSLISGVGTLTATSSPLITNDFEYNGTAITTYQMPYNTFYAVDTPIVVSAVDTNNMGTRIYFTFMNSTAVTNSPNFNL